MKAKGYRIDNDTMHFEDRVGLPCFCGLHRLTYRVVIKGVEQLDVVVEPTSNGSLLRCMADGVNYFVYRQWCS